MVQGVNCGFVFPPRNLEHHTCTCGDGYMNDEGTLIPGSIIKEGYALGKAEYHAHKNCERCAVNPLHCDWRRQQLNAENPRSTITAPPDGIFDFFVPGEGVSESVLQAFLRRNSRGDTTCLPERRFKARPSVMTKSRRIANASRPGRERLLRAFQLPFQHPGSQPTQGAHTVAASRKQLGEPASTHVASL